eukprot:gnl/TRDRNA2_/TRDRNA2_166485_c0_seq1.p1 gnl/TRDRNA2_/TRDRNA2_166485_c0~~gnl/TRDRNA2_/TRDRNA2_166485_c0_seq1.p1  ORF type:complete len:200 (+),score=35.00 gnl/TRDRNA2_/TRDRNA2_166485_c0_seq1:84-602(+)
MAGAGSRALGIDIDINLIDVAQHYLNDPDAHDAAVQVPPLSTVEAQVGNAFMPELNSLRISAGSVDAINVGFAVVTLAHLERLVELLRVNGAMVVPICRPIPEQPRDIAVDMCLASLYLFRKGFDGSLTPDTTDELLVPFMVVRTEQEWQEAMSNHSGPIHRKRKYEEANWW